MTFCRTRVETLNDYVLRTIRVAGVPLPSLAQVLPFPIYASDPTREAVVKMFTFSMDTVSNQASRLREEAEVSMRHLIRLEEHLSILYEMVHKEKQGSTVAQEDVLAELWTLLRESGGEFGEVDLTLNLLKNVNKYRQQALAYIVTTLRTLHTLDENMEELRAKVAAPDTIGDRVPTEVHVKSIQEGVERLRQRRIEASARREWQGPGNNQVD